MEKLFRKGLLLEYFTVVYNLGEAAASIIFGKIASSIALVGFGLGLHYLFGFWQADPAVGIIIVIFLVREGVEGWRESQER